MNKIKIAKQLIKLAKDLVESQSTLMTETNIKQELEKVHIKQYLPFRKIHTGEWIAFPINRNANLPDIYIHFDDGKLTAGYSYVSQEELDYQGAEQESLVGMLEELAIIKNKINEIVINTKNEKLDENEQNSKEQEDSSDLDSELQEDEDFLDEEEKEFLDEQEEDASLDEEQEEI